MLNQLAVKLAGDFFFQDKVKHIVIPYISMAIKVDYITLVIHWLTNKMNLGVVVKHNNKSTECK